MAILLDDISCILLRLVSWIVLVGIACFLVNDIWCIIISIVSCIVINYVSCILLSDTFCTSMCNISYMVLNCMSCIVLYSVWYKVLCYSYQCDASCMIQSIKQGIVLGDMACILSISYTLSTDTYHVLGDSSSIARISTSYIFTKGRNMH